MRRPVVALAIAAALGASVACRAQAGPDGAALFAQHCAACHQADGSGTVGLAPPIKGEHWARLGADRTYLPTVLLHGLAGPIKVGGTPFVGAMPGFGPQLDDATLAAIANHARRLQGAAADERPYTADDIKALRAAPGSPPQTRALRLKLLPN